MFAPLAPDQIERIRAMCEKPSLSYSGGGLNVGQIKEALALLGDVENERLLKTGKRAQLVRALCKRYKEIENEARIEVGTVCTPPLRSKGDDGECPRFFAPLTEDFVDKDGNERKGTRGRCCRPSLKSAAQEIVTSLAREMPVLEDVNEVKGLSVKDKREINEKLKAINEVSWEKVKDEPTSSFKVEWVKSIAGELAKNIDNGTVKVDQYGKEKQSDKGDDKQKEEVAGDDDDEPEVEDLREWEKAHGVDEKKETWLQWMLRWGNKLVQYGISLGVWIAQNPLIVFVISAIVDDLLKVVCNYVRTHFITTEYRFSAYPTFANLQNSFKNWIDTHWGMISVFLYTAVQEFPFVESIQRLYNTYAIGSSLSTIIGAAFGTASMLTTALSYTFSAILNYSTKIATETVLLSLSGQRLASMYLTITKTCFQPLIKFTQNPKLLKGKELEQAIKYFEQQRKMRAKIVQRMQKFGQRPVPPPIGGFFQFQM